MQSLVVPSGAGLGIGSASLSSASRRSFSRRHNVCFSPFQRVYTVGVIWRACSGISPLLRRSALLSNKFIGKWTGLSDTAGPSGGLSAGFIAGPVAAVGPDSATGSGSQPHYRGSSPAASVDSKGQQLGAAPEGDLLTSGSMSSRPKEASGSHLLALKRLRPCFRRRERR